jgi:hypothetical protein
MNARPDDELESAVGQRCGCLRVQVRVAQLYPGTDAQAGELGPAPVDAVEVSRDVKGRRLVDAVRDLAPDRLNVGGGVTGDRQCGEVCVVGEGNRGQAKLGRPRARLPHRPVRRIRRPLRMDMLVSGKHLPIVSHPAT